MQFRLKRIKKPKTLNKVFLTIFNKEVFKEFLRSVKTLKTYAKTKRLSQKKRCESLFLRVKTRKRVTRLLIFNAKSVLLKN